MSLFTTIGLTPACERLATNLKNYLNSVDEKKFDNATLKDKLLRTVVAVKSLGIAYVGVKVGMHFGAQILTTAPLLLVASVISIATASITLGASLLFLIPIGMYSIPAIIQSVGAILALTGGAAGLYIAGKSWSII